MIGAGVTVQGQLRHLWRALGQVANTKSPSVDKAQPHFAVLSLLLTMSDFPALAMPNMWIHPRCNIQQYLEQPFSLRPMEILSSLSTIIIINIFNSVSQNVKPKPILYPIQKWYPEEHLRNIFNIFVAYPEEHFLSPVLC